MKVSDMKEFLNSLPPEYANYEIMIASNIEEIDDDKFFIKHDPLVCMIADDEHKEVMVFNRTNADAFGRVTGEDEEGDENG